MKYNVLYIDDEPENLRVFKSIFRRNYNVFLASTGKEGLQILDKIYFHLIITDQRMPEMTGVEFLKKVYEKMPTTPPNRIILSGYSRTKDIDLAKEKYGLFMFISKPWEKDELKLLLDEAIADSFEEKLVE